MKKRKTFPSTWTSSSSLNPLLFPPHSYTTQLFHILKVQRTNFSLPKQFFCSHTLLVVYLLNVNIWFIILLQVFQEGGNNNFMKTTPQNFQDFLEMFYLLVFLLEKHLLVTFCSIIYKSKKGDGWGWIVITLPEFNVTLSFKSFAYLCAISLLSVWIDFIDSNGTDWKMFPDISNDISECVIKL